MKRHEKIPCSKSIDHPTADDLILAANRGLYTPESEHESCGVGLIASIDGKPRRDVIEAGISALKSVWHRGALDADGKTGDGAGIHIEISQSFFINL